MFDYMTLEATEFDPDALLRNPLFEWGKAEYNQDGEIFKQETRNTFRTIKLCLSWFGGYPKLYVSLSLHKFFDEGVNWTDFTLPNVIDATNELSEILEIPDKDLQVHSIEFGVNIQTDRHPERVFSKYISYQSKPFVSFSHTRPNSRVPGVECYLSHFRIKAYDKGSQYYQTEVHRMRFELHVDKMQFLYKKKVVDLTLHELTNPDVWRTLETILLKVYMGIFKIQNVDTASMSEPQRLMFKAAKTYSHWEELKNTAKRDTYQKSKRRFEDFMRRFQVDNMHEHVQALIVEKVRYLLHPFGHYVHNVTTLQDTYPDEAPHSTTLLESPLNYIVECTQQQQPAPRPLTPKQQELYERRKCVICEKDISRRRADAKTCSKSCRNHLSNPANNTRRSIQRILDANSLFDARAHIDPKVVRYRLKLN